MTRILGEDLTILFAVAVLVLAFIFYEIIGLTVPGQHTISYLAHNFPPLRLLILAAFVLAPIWWWLHSGQPIPR